VSQKKSFKFPKFKGLKNTKKPNKTSPAAARKILRGPLFWIIAALIAVSIFGQISATGEEFKKVETSVILNEISLNNVKSALVIDREQKVQVVLKDGEFVDGAAKIEASYVAGQEALIVELLTSNPPSTTWDIKVPKQSLFVSLILSILPILADKAVEFYPLVDQGLNYKIKRCLLIHLLMWQVLMKQLLSCVKLKIF